MIYVFHHYELDTTRQELRLAGAPIRVEPKVFDVLTYLVERHGQLVSREVLHEHLWPQQFVSEAALAYCITAARKAIGDSGRAQNMIRTVHGRGYRFIGTVQARLPNDPILTNLPPPHLAAPGTASLLGLTDETAALADATPFGQPLAAHGQTSEDEIGRGADAGMDVAERRQLTVLWCRGVTTSQQAIPLDPEALHRVIQDAYTVCSEIIRRFGGRIAQHLDHGFVVYFGHPLAHEDDARRAVYTALEMLRSLQQLAQTLLQEGMLDFTMQIGIHTGIVVMSTLGSGNKRMALALGDTPHIAAQLAQLAAPNTILVSAATFQLVDGYVLQQPLGVHILDDVAEPLVVYRILQASAAQSRITVTLALGATPFINREPEVALLQQRWEQSKEAMGQVVMLSGEAGIGKSRLVAVLRERVEGAPSRYLDCYCSPYYQHSVLHPLLEYLRRQLQWHQDMSSQSRLASLEAAIADAGFPLEETVPLFAALLSLPLPARYTTPDMTPAQFKQRTFTALLLWLLKQAERHTLCLIIEDLHWADPSTLEFLTLLIDQIPTTRLFIVLTHRPEFLPPWTGRSHVTQLALGRLTRTQVEQMVTRLTRGKALPAAVQQQLLTKANGVPLFIEEMTKMVLESGIVKEQEHSYELTGPLPSLSIPLTLHDSLMARLDRQGPGKVVAQLGATLGREFSYAMIQAVALLDDTILQQGLEQLVHAEILYQRGNVPQSRYVFKHTLIQEAAYQSLLRHTRQQYHRQIAQILEERFPETRDTEPELLAHHHIEADSGVQALRYLQAAGQRAMERSAYLEATEHLSKGLEILKTLPSTKERLHHELAFSMALGTALMAVKGQTAPEVERTYAHAYTLCQQLSASTQLFQALMGLWRYYGARAELHMAHMLAEQLMQIAQRSHDTALRLEAHMALGNSLFFEGAFAAARPHLTQGLALYDPQQHATHAVHYGRDPGVVCASLYSLALWKLGYPEQAVHMSQHALILAHNRAHPLSLAFALYLAAVLYQFRRDPQPVQEHAMAGISLALKHDLGPWITGQLMTLRGWSVVMQGQGEEGLNRIRQGIQTLQSIGAEMPWPLIHLVDAYREMGRVEDGLRTLANSLSAYGLNDTSLHKPSTGRQAALIEAPSLYWLKGELLLQLAPPDEEQAALCFQQAIDLARYQQARSDELRIVLSLCRLWHAQHKSQPARRLLSETYGWFTEGLETPDLSEAKRLLRLLPSSRLPSSSSLEP